MPTTEADSRRKILFAYFLRVLEFFVAFGLLVSLSVKLTSTPDVVSLTHVTSGQISSPLDHNYIAFDSLIHPAINAEIQVQNDCAVWNGKDNEYEFCGMMPWQNSDICSDAYLQDWKESTTVYNVIKGSDLATGIHDFGKQLDTTNTKYIRRLICETETYNGAKIIVNSDDSFSMSSAHSSAVLVWGAWLVLFISSFMDLKNSMKRNQKVDSSYLGGYNPEQVSTMSDIFFVLILVGWFLAVRLSYGLSTRDGNVENVYGSETLLTPNGSFAYALIAAAWSFLFLRKSHHDIFDPQKQPETSTVQSLLGFPSDTPLSNSAAIKPDPAVQEVGTAQKIDISNFSVPKFKTKAYVQVGKNDNGTDMYPKQTSFTDVDYIQLDGKINQYAYELVKFGSDHFVLTQLWALPLVALAMAIYKNNYELDMHVLAVFILVFIYTVLDLVRHKLYSMQEAIETLFWGKAIVVSEGRMKHHKSLWIVFLVIIATQIVTVVAYFGFQDMNNWNNNGHYRPLAISYFVFQIFFGLIEVAGVVNKFQRPEIKWIFDMTSMLRRISLYIFVLIITLEYIHKYEMISKGDNNMMRFWSQSNNEFTRQHKGVVSGS